MDQIADLAKGSILMVAPQPFFRARGTPFSVLHRVRALCESGYRVDLVTYPFGDNVDIDGLTIVRSRRPPLVTDVKIGPSAAKLMLDFPLYLTTRRLLAEKPYTVIHSHEEAAFFCAGLARKHELPHIYDMHSSLPHQLANFETYDVHPIRRVFESLEHRVLTSCDGIITICPELAEIAAPLCGSTPHAMIENTADDRKVFGASIEEVLEPYELGEGPVVLYTGTFEPYQGLDLLLRGMAKAVDEFPSSKLVMVGGQPGQVEKYEKLADELGLDGKVVFTGTVHPSKIPGFIDAATLIVSPRSSGTNTPLKIYGYMRSGRPLVATDLLTHRQVLDESTAVLVPPTPAGIADGIRLCLSNPRSASIVARNAKARANEHFSDDSYVHKVVNLYQQALDWHSTKRACPNKA